MTDKAETNELLARLARSLDRVGSEDGSPFFSLRMLEDLDEMARRFERAATRNELWLDNGHSHSSLVLDEAFPAGSFCLDFFRGVHFAADSRFMVSPVVDSWTARVDELIRGGRLAGVRRLVIYSDLSELGSPSARRFIVSDRQKPGREYRALQVSAYRAVLGHAGLDVPHDFGVYADKYVFQSASQDPASLSGIWLKGVPVVQVYRRAFDECWDLAEDENYV